MLPESPPQDGESWDVIRKDIDTKIVPGLTHWQSPNFFAFFPCPASYPSILGELYSAAFSAASFNWICSPAVTELGLEHWYFLSALEAWAPPTTAALVVLGDSITDGRGSDDNGNNRYDVSPKSPYVNLQYPLTYPEVGPTY